jgi:hypothetical protein
MKYKKYAQQSKHYSCASQRKSEQDACRIGHLYTQYLLYCSGSSAHYYRKPSIYCTLVYNMIINPPPTIPSSIS